MSSRSSGSNNVNALILGGVSLLSLAGICFYLYKGKKTIDHKGFKEHKPTEADSTKDDEEEEEEEESEESIKKAEEAALKESYDDALRLAKKLLLGSAFARAAVKYSEAIEMVPRIPSAKKDLVTLYNNRSAMYEKAGEIEKSLLDIAAVLAIDIFHIKARTRRGRLYESQDMLPDALNEYVAVIFADRKNGTNPSTIDKADEVCRLLAAKKTAARLEEVRASALVTTIPLPMKSYCRKFFEALPSIHLWREQSKNADREQISSRYKAASVVSFTDKSESSAFELLSSAAELVRLDLANSLFSRAFTTINSVLDLISEESAEMEIRSKVLLSFIWQLKGVEHLFRRADSLAVAAELKAIELDSTNLEAKLVLCILYLELVHIKEAEELVTACLAQITEAAPEGGDTQSKLRTAWVMVQRSQIWVARNESGMFTQDAVLGAIRDLDIAIELTEESMNEEPKRIRLAAMLKIVNILLQLKIQTGQAPTEADQDRVKKCVTDAKALFPKHEEVLMLDAESAASEGMFDQALSMMDGIIASGDPADTMSSIIKANILMQKAFFADQSGSQEAAQETQRLLVEVQDLYEKAVILEPNALEAMVQCAQLLGMTGQVDRSLDMSTKAVSLTRNREEMQVLIQLILFTEAQIKVSKEME